MLETIILIIAGIVAVIVFCVLIIGFYRDYKISKEWERIFKKGGRDD